MKNNNKKDVSIRDAFFWVKKELVQFFLGSIFPPEPNYTFWVKYNFSSGTKMYLFLVKKELKY